MSFLGNTQTQTEASVCSAQTSARCEGAVLDLAEDYNSPVVLLQETGVTQAHLLTLSNFYHRKGWQSLFGATCSLHLVCALDRVPVTTSFLKSPSFCKLTLTGPGSSPLTPTSTGLQGSFARLCETWALPLLT